jgi:hypothetical protein
MGISPASASVDASVDPISGDITAEAINMIMGAYSKYKALFRKMQVPKISSRQKPSRWITQDKQLNFTCHI